MEIKVDIKIEGALLKKLLENPGEVSRKMLWSGMTNLVEEIEARAVKEIPVKAGNLVHSVTSTVSADGRKGMVAATAKYAAYVHEGTGVFGPLGKKIVPTIKKALFWPGAAHPFRSVKGQRPNPFFTRALQKTKPQQVFEAGVWGYLKQIGG